MDRWEREQLDANLRDLALLAERACRALAYVAGDPEDRNQFRKDAEFAHQMYVSLRDSLRQRGLDPRMDRFDAETLSYVPKKPFGEAGVNSGRYG